MMILMRHLNKMGMSGRKYENFIYETSKAITGRNNQET